MSLESTYKDVIYYNDIQIGFIYSHKNESIYWFDQNFNFYVYEKIWLSGSFGKLFRKDKSMRHLFINTFFNEIEIHFGVGQGFYENRLKINNIKGKCIVDFRPIDLDKLLIITSDGYIILVEYSQKEYSYIVEYKENNLEDFFEISCNVCSREDYFAVSSQRDLHVGEVKVYKFNEDKRGFFLRSSMDLRPQSNANFMYFIKEFNLDFYIKEEEKGKEYPVVLAFQLKSDYLMIPFQLQEKNDDIRVINSYARIERECCHRTTFYQGNVWTIDRLGRVFKIELSE